MAFDVKNIEAVIGAATIPFGVRLIMVLPVPWTFFGLLKFETRMSPGEIAPPVGKLAGTKATPYGLRSAWGFGGTVDEMMMLGMNCWALTPTVAIGDSASAAASRLPRVRSDTFDMLPPVRRRAPARASLLDMTPEIAIYSPRISSIARWRRKPGSGAVRRRLSVNEFGDARQQLA